MSDNGTWLDDDEVPDTINPIVAVFFEEMWPFLSESMQALDKFIDSDLHEVGNELPRKTFTASAGFELLQSHEGALTVPFSIGGVRSRRMVVPYQMWMLQRIEAAMNGSDQQRLAPWLLGFPHGEEVLAPDSRMSGYRVKKQGGLLYSTDI